MIYLDHAAATPVSRPALEAMLPFFEAEFFNPSAPYLPAKQVRDSYEAAKNDLAHVIGTKGNDLIITAGATEANNLTFTVVSSTPQETEQGFAKNRTKPNEKTEQLSTIAVPKPEQTPAKILYLETEHASVRNLAESLGGEAIKILPRNGRIDLKDLKAKITPETELISVALVNNEIGVVQPLSEIAAVVRNEKLNRLKSGNKTPLYLHSDASQALGLLDLNVSRLGMDLLTLNSAKVYGPKGVGALYVNHGLKLKPLVQGGGQEQGLRSGTENVPGLIGFSVAATEAKAHLHSNRQKYATLKKLFLANLQGYELVPTKNSLDNFINLCYNGIDGERLIYLLEAEGVLVATGAACAASKGEKSHVLTALGLSDSEIRGSLRITLGATNTEEQIIKAAEIINRVVAAERERQRQRNE